MKEILSSQYDQVFGGSDNNGSGQKPLENGGSTTSNNNGSSSNRSWQMYHATMFSHGSGAGASGFWGGGARSMSTGNGYSGNGTGPQRK